MQSQNFTELMNDAFKHPSDEPIFFAPRMSKLALKNRQDLSTKEVQDYLRLPTAE